MFPELTFRLVPRGAPTPPLHVCVTLNHSVRHPNLHLLRKIKTQRDHRINGPRGSYSRAPPRGRTGALQQPTGANTHLQDWFLPVVGFTYYHQAGGDDDEDGEEEDECIKTF